jgi:hypothetical protein
MHMHTTVRIRSYKQKYGFHQSTELQSRMRIRGRVLMAAAVLSLCGRMHPR